MATRKSSKQDFKSQTGSSGRDVIQVGRDYLRFIQIHLDSGNWFVLIIHGVFLLMMISGTLFGIKLAINYFQFNTFTTNTNTEKQSSLKPADEESVKQSSNPFDAMSFPQESCGDPLPLDKSQYPLSLYRVFINDVGQNFKKVKDEFCQDAFKKRPEGDGRAMVQVASFLSIERANHFKDFMTSKIGSGEVGEEVKIANIPPDLAIKAEEKERSESGFQKVLINCRVSPAAKVADLELPVCQLRYGQLFAPLKNYSGVWYEMEFPDGSANLVSPGAEELMPLNPEGFDMGFETACMLNPNFSNCKNKPPLQQLVWVKQYSHVPSKTVKVSCSDNPRTVWGIKITPKCTSNGTYIDIASSVQRTIELSLDNGQTTTYQPSWGGSTGYVTSTSSSVSFTLSVK